MRTTMLNTNLPLFVHTPLLHSHPLSRFSQRAIYLKMEALQSSGSFKDRGIGTLCQFYAKQGAMGLVCSSGGNAGMAVAYASKKLNLPATIIIPTITPLSMVNKLKAEKVKVILHGENWNAADELAKEIAKSQSLAYIPPFDHPLIWQGHASIVHELKKDGIKPDAILLAVGGGGLYAGIVQGLQEVDWAEVTIITAETTGAASFAQSVQANQRIILPQIDTVAVTLGAKQISQRAFELSKQHPTKPQVVSDQEAVKACLNFANDHRILVEPACGAALAVVYEKRKIIQQFKNIVIIICGGSGVDLNLLNEWRKKFAL